MEKYTWVKAPRYNGSPIQVGRWRMCWSATLRPSPHTQMDGHRFQDNFLVHGFQDDADDLQSTMGRYLARGIRSAMLSTSRCSTGNLLTDNILKGDDNHLQPAAIPFA